MKKLGTFLIFTISLLLSTISFGQEHAEQPVYKDGDWWHFKVTERDFVGSTSKALDGIYGVTYSNGKLKFFKPSGDQTTKAVGESIAEDADESGGEGDTEGAYGQTTILSWMLGRGKYYGGQSLKFPLSVGQTWAVEFSIRARGAKPSARPSPRRAELSVVGTEDIATPAGKFRAFKIVWKGKVLTARAAGGSGQEFTYFYSPETKSIVRVFFEFGTGAKRDVELIKSGSAPEK